MAGFRSSSLVVLILVLCQTWSPLVAAPALTVAKRSADKGHPPAAAADWNVNGDMQQVDVNLAEERLKRENETNMHNLELELKEDDARWVLKEPKSDELADELKSLKTPENDGHTKTSTAAVIGAAGGGQLEQDDKLGYYNEWHDTQDELPQPTQKQMQREQQQIDDGIQLELNKDRVETMERIPVGHNDKEFPWIPSPHVNPPTSTAGPIQTSTKGLSSETPSQRNLGIPLRRLELDSITQQDEHKELLKEAPQQNEDHVSAFTNNGNRRSINNHQPMSVTGKVPQLKLNKETVLKAHNNGGRYSAHDLAQYVFWTGDEEGVAQAIEELINEGLMSRENALLFLRDIRTNLEYLQNSYTNQDTTKPSTAQDKLKSKPVTPARFLKQIPATTLHSQVISTPPTVAAFDWNNNGGIVKPYKGTTGSASLMRALMLGGNSMEYPFTSKLNAQPMTGRVEDSFTAPEADIDDKQGRLRLANFLYNEYTLEEVVYELARVMFGQALLEGSETAQDGLQKFIAFLETEVQAGRISSRLQTKVIDILMKALSDTMAEHPELVEMTKQYLKATANNNNNISPAFGL